MDYFALAIEITGQRVGAEVERRLVAGESTPEDVFDRYKERPDEEIRQIRDRFAPAGGKFAEVLTQILEDREDWEEHV